LTRPVFEAKRLMRMRCRRQRDELGEEKRREAGLAICQHIESWPRFESAEAILTYMPMRGEVDLRPLLERHPAKHWALPRIQSEGHMVFHPYDSERLVEHAYGMLEPAADLSQVSTAEIDLALVPALAFDRRGYRLGYGGGFFDRFLADFKGVSLGVTYQALIMDALPVGEHDIRVEYVVSEVGINICDGGE
jgi:5-formyltetrahydrofolate cyclo-ligase